MLGQLLAAFPTPETMAAAGGEQPPSSGAGTEPTCPGTSQAAVAAAASGAAVAAAAGVAAVAAAGDNWLALGTEGMSPGASSGGVGLSDTSLSAQPIVGAYASTAAEAFPGATAAPDAEAACQHCTAAAAIPASSGALAAAVVAPVAPADAAGLAVAPSVMALDSATVVTAGTLSQWQAVTAAAAVATAAGEAVAAAVACPGSMAVAPGGAGAAAAGASTSGVPLSGIALLENILRPLGLFRVRARGLVRFSQEYLTKQVCVPSLAGTHACLLAHWLLRAVQHVFCLDACHWGFWVLRGAELIYTAATQVCSRRTCTSRGSTGANMFCMHTAHCTPPLPARYSLRHAIYCESCSACTAPCKHLAACTPCAKAPIGILQPFH